MHNTTYLLDYFGNSDIGLVRNHNEDVWYGSPEKRFFILADGMGGHLAGEVAAKEAVEYLVEIIESKDFTEENPEDVALFFRKAFTDVNRFIYEKGRSESALAGMGTTLCLLYFLQGSGVVAHVGDSRIYLYRNEKLTPLTEDHSLISELMTIGAMKPDEVKSFPYRHILTRAIGTNPQVEPTLNIISVEPKDLFLLCSDGLTNAIDDDAIETILKKKESLEERGNGLIHLANEKGGADNITIILVKIANNLSR